MKVRCANCRGRGHVGGWSRICTACGGDGFFEQTAIAPTAEHGTIAAYDAGCRCGKCVAIQTRTAVETPLGRELGLAPSTDLPPLTDDELPDDGQEPAETWLTSLHENCGNGPTIRAPLSGGLYHCWWPCGVESDVAGMPFSSIRDPGWMAFHDLALAAAERALADREGPAAKGTAVR